MHRGTFLIELSLTGIAKAQPILRVPLLDYSSGHLSVLALPHGSFSLVNSQGRTLTHGTLRLAGAQPAERVRVSYFWDCDAGWARFAVEQVDGAGLAVVRMDAPEPMAERSLTAFGAMRVGEAPGVELDYLALSRGIEPMGPQPGLGARTLVETSYGPRELCQLQCGDQVLTSDGRREPVLHVAERVVPGLGSFAPVRLRAPYYGLQRDIVVAPHQKLFVTGAGVDYTFGCEGVLVRAEHLMNGISAIAEPGLPLVRYAQVLLPVHAVIVAAGTWVESLYVGRLRRDAVAMAATLLDEVDPALLPEHAHLTVPVLKRYEAQALSEVA